ncbi:DUF222 domain-containing protein [Sphaerisporangium sp. NPDC049002]|uniref:HNH endonuclease signature motif containing protein n=1 Tax=unclassified Sphaerisporangium TaxID=2630420 RepID=UPI00340C113A
MLVGRVREAAEALAVAPVPESPAICAAEVEDLVFARDRLTSAIAARVGRVHASGEARAQGHASTKTWLRSGCGMSMPAAGHLVCLSSELARLPVVRERFASGTLPEGMVSAICAATAHLNDEQTQVAEPILVSLADEASPGEVAKAGRYLREVLVPDATATEAEADHAARFLIVRPSATGGMEGEFQLPREAAARLKTLLDTYARPRTDGDDRPLRVRNADAFIALLEQQITTELLILVNAASLPDDPLHPSSEAHGARTAGSVQAKDGDTPHPQTWHAKTRYKPAPTDPAGPFHAEPAGSRRYVDSAGCGGSVEEEQPAQRVRRRPAGADDDMCGRCGQRADRSLPAMLPATGQLLPAGDIHRLARTSTLIRIVMNADGQVLDMGRKVRLATPSQRRAVIARYATCWVEGCPLPATMCQIDHAHSWTHGGPTDLKNLGPACQFHNRDRYRHPDRYQRRRTGKDRWTYTYLGRSQSQQHHEDAARPHPRT